jgi:hypothetical protein
MIHTYPYPPTLPVLRIQRFAIIITPPWQTNRALLPCCCCLLAQQPRSPGGGRRGPRPAGGLLLALAVIRSRTRRHIDRPYRDMDDENGWDIVGMSPAVTEADLSDAIAQAKAGKARRMARIGAEGGSTQDSTSAPSGDGGGGGDDSSATPQRQWPCAAPVSTLDGRTGAVGGWKQLELSSADGDVFDLSFVFDRNWWVEPSRAPSLTDAPPTHAVTRHDCCAGVLRDTFELHDVLSRAECEAIVRLADGVGFQRPKCGGGIGSQASTLPPPDRFVWVTDAAWCKCVYARLEQCLPQSIRGRRPVGINPRWRLYKYEPGFALLRHQDRSFKAVQLVSPLSVYPVPTGWHSQQSPRPRPVCCFRAAAAVASRHQGWGGAPTLPRRGSRAAWRDGTPRLDGGRALLLGLAPRRAAPTRPASFATTCCATAPIPCSRC